MADIYPVSVSLSYTKAVVKKGKSVQVDAGVVYSNGKRDNRIQYSQSGTGYVSFVTINSSDISRTAITMLCYRKGIVNLLVSSKVDPSVCNVCSVNIIDGGSASTEERPVVGLMITGSLQLEVGEKGRIKELIFPINASNRKVKYTCSDTSVATVDSKGNVTAVSNGKASIVVTTIDGNYSLVCDVTVGKQEYSVVTGVELSKYNLVLAKGDVSQVKAYVLSEGKYDSAGVYCSTSNEVVASLANPVSHSTSSNESLITIKANAVGTATFTVRSVTDLTKYARLNVTVVQSSQEVYTPIKQVEAIPETISVPVNTEFEITGRALLDIPGSNINRYSGDVSFSSSSSSVAEIIRTYSDSTTINRCTIKSGASAGQATITVTSNSDPSKKATCKVYVGQATPSDDGTVTNPVKSVKLNKREIELAEGDYYQLSATVTGKFTDRSVTNPTVLWSSNNRNVFVNSYGRVLAVKVGSSVVTAVSQETPSIYDYCIVTVRERTDDDGPIVTPDDEGNNGTDTIVRIDYNSNGTFDYTKLFEGNLGFDLKHPIESVVYHETEDIQKIYWVDGKNVLRFMNFMEKPDETTGLYPWQYSSNSYDNTYFDSNRAIDFGVDVKITKDNSGNTRPNGVVQYLLTYYNKHGQESGYAWISDLIYLSPAGHGGSADGTNNNSVVLKISRLDTRFAYFRIYSIFRSSLNGQTVGYLVADSRTSVDSVVIVDDGAHLISEDSKRLLFLGSESAKAGTLTHKDQTLFLGDLQSIGKEGYDELEQLIKQTMLSNVSCITFEYSSGNGEFGDIPLKDYESEIYSYENQLDKSSSQITTFKGGEKYRFALSFCRKDGSMSDAFWVGDAVNEKYPVMTPDGIHRAIAKCTIPEVVIDKARSIGFSTVRLMVAEATYADRSVKAQGIVNPTMFNVWERYNNRLYAQPSWISRPRNSDYAWKHFSVVHNSMKSTGEIQCNYWTGIEPFPYYKIDDFGTPSARINGLLDGMPDCDYYKIVYLVGHVEGGMDVEGSGIYRFSYNFWAGYEFVGVRLKEQSSAAISAMENHEFTEEELSTPGVIDDNPYYSLHISGRTTFYAISTLITDGIGFVRKAADKLWPRVFSSIKDEHNIPVENIVDSERFAEWFRTVYDFHGSNHEYAFFNYQNSSTVNDSWVNAFNLPNTWYEYGEHSISGSFDRQDSYYKKHVMFVDENIITLNSPELTYDAVNFDGVDDNYYKFRIVGAIKLTAEHYDYVVNASPGKLPGENLVSNAKPYSINGLSAWPLWREYGLSERMYEENDDKTEYEHLSSDVKDWSSYDYVWGGNIVRYWLYMWNHSGKINGFTDYDENDYSELHSKTFANIRYAGLTVYNNYLNNQIVMDMNSIRIFNQLSSQYLNINIANEQKQYDGYINQSLSLPGSHKYPIIYSAGIAADEDTYNRNTFDAYLYSNSPVILSYGSTPHAVIAFRSSYTDDYYFQTILPMMFDSEAFSITNYYEPVKTSNPIIPWIDNSAPGSYPYKKYSVTQGKFTLNDSTAITQDDKYLYIGEIYYDFDHAEDTRYGGKSISAVKNNRFIPAGPQYSLSDNPTIIYGNQGDTYFQRWDCMKTKPYSTGSVNNVIDITSAMLETHINIDGVSDQQRGTRYIASIDTEKFGQLNPVYSQNNNFITRRDLDEDFNLDAYRSSITWTLEKHDSADVDEWTHITLANTLKLDGDKGVCQALRRFGNSIIAFQDRGISEILFNSRTQLSTQDGVPVEIANSGKVDGKRYITNKFGCTNKWSIIEGKSALYFVDNINKAFCAFGGQGIEPLSDKLGFGTWFRRNNETEAWNPKDFNNIVAFHDKVHSDIYLVKNNDSEEQPCLVYNEAIGAFTSFFDYASVPMMANVNDKFVSFKNHKLWLQNEGMYCNFFGKQYDYWIQYRVTPEPFSDKIWTNIDYRADFYEVLNSGADPYVPEEKLINGDVYDFNNDLYKEWETFTDYRVWDEYQDTGYTPFTHEKFDRDDVRKKFRIWRLTIPRALKEGTNKHGMDRIRNPWINLLFRKEMSDGKYLMQLHDIVVKYFE